jgi:hypothetical protein
VSPARLALCVVTKNIILSWFDLRLGNQGTFPFNSLNGSRRSKAEKPQHRPLTTVRPIRHMAWPALAVLLCSVAEKRRLFYCVVVSKWDQNSSHLIHTRSSYSTLVVYPPGLYSRQRVSHKLHRVIELLRGYLFGTVNAAPEPIKGSH